MLDQPLPIKLLRRRLLLTQVDLARETGVSLATIRKIERLKGKHIPYPSTMKQIATTLGVEATDVLEFWIAIGSPPRRVEEPTYAEEEL